MSQQMTALNYYTCLKKLIKAQLDVTNEQRLALRFNINHEAVRRAYQVQYLDELQEPSNIKLIRNTQFNEVRTILGNTFNEVNLDNLMHLVEIRKRVDYIQRVKAQCLEVMSFKEFSFTETGM